MATILTIDSEKDPFIVKKPPLAGSKQFVTAKTKQYCIVNLRVLQYAKFGGMKEVASNFYIERSDIPITGGCARV